MKKHPAILITSHAFYPALFAQLEKDVADIP